MIISKAPLRVSLAGGGTDFPDYYRQLGGEVISMAIDKFVYLIVKERYDDKIYLNYSIKEVAECLDDLEHDLIREAMRLTGVASGVEITTLADIPAHGSGLGSSSCVTISALKALYAYQGVTISTEALVQQACEIEIEILGKPIGKQDQYIIAYGGLRHIQFGLDETVIVNHLEIGEDTRRKLNANTLLFYTGTTRQSEMILSEQKDKTKRNLASLSQMKSLVKDLKSVLLHHEGNGPNSLNAVGEILHAGWELKKALASKITNDRLCQIYKIARQAGAIGGKLLGAGGGGFFLFYALPDRQDDIRRALRDLQEFPFSIKHDGSKIIFNVR